MSGGPGFDPYAVLGVGREADAVVIQLAYRARIREAHPDVAGDAGLDRAKILNIARDWLLDPDLRAQLTSPPGPVRATQETHYRGGPRPSRTSGGRRPAGARDGAGFDADHFDFGPQTSGLRAFLHGARQLTADERARVNYSLGDGRPVDFAQYEDYVAPRLWELSQALRDAVAVAWEQGVDDQPPVVAPLGQLIPTGFLVANAYAQWMLLGDFFRQELAPSAFRSDHVMDTFMLRCVAPWQASVGQARYGPNERHVTALLHTASTLPLNGAAQLARSWRKYLGRDGEGKPADDIGPGVWLPAPPNYPEVLKVSGYLAAVDASRIDPPQGLDAADVAGFRYGIRISAHVVAMGMRGRAARDYLRPWRDATDHGTSLWSRVRTRMPVG
jgi:curved DNA-binding protein CbpA